MAQIKSMNRVAGKWADNASRAGSQYVEGVKNPRRSWEASTVAAEKNYEQGVAEAVSRKAFSAGVKSAGDSKWQARAEALGGARFSSGILASSAEYEKGFAPYHTMLSTLPLPPRGAKGSPANLLRVATVANAMRNLKIKKA